MPIVGGFNRPKIGKEILFDLSDWSLVAGQYVLDIQHNLETEKITTTWWENETEEVTLGRVEILNTNTVRVKVPSSPDCRISGKVIIIQI